jgi:hypothetical protein
MAKHAFFAAVALCSVAGPADAGCFQRLFGHCGRRSSVSVTYRETYQVQGYAAPQAIYAQPQCSGGSCPLPTAQGPVFAPAPAKVMPQAQATGDPTGFLVLLNVERRRRGLREVLYDAGLTGWCRQNNAAQVSRGLGHWVNPGFLQCSFVGPSNAQSALYGWMASGPHAAILFSPSITVIGVDGYGSAWTLDAR